MCAHLQNCLPCCLSAPQVLIIAIIVLKFDWVSTFYSLIQSFRVSLGKIRVICQPIQCQSMCVCLWRFRCELTNRMSNKEREYKYIVKNNKSTTNLFHTHERHKHSSLFFCCYWHFVTFTLTAWIIWRWSRGDLIFRGTCNRTRQMSVSLLVDVENWVGTFSIWVKLLNIDLNSRMKEKLEGCKLKVITAIAHWMLHAFGRGYFPFFRYH